MGVRPEHLEVAPNGSWAVEVRAVEWLGHECLISAVAGDEPRGILRLTAPMFARQLATFRGTPEGLARFGVFFGQGLLRAYRGPFRRYSV